MEVVTTKKKYVVGFAFNTSTKEVLLIKKNKPEWQKGLLNGIGGKVESGETFIDVMVREFYEECGIHTDAMEWDQVCAIEGQDYVLYFFRTVLHSTRFYKFKQMTPELVNAYSLVDLLGDRLNVVENLRWIVPFCYRERLYNNGNVYLTDTDYDP